VPCTDEFFVKRIFSVFDADGSGTVSLAEFIEAMARFSGHNLDSKIEFLFKVN
jgi:Ca2+-binding EF-hand superfamily protein